MYDQIISRYPPHTLASSMQLPLLPQHLAGLGYSAHMVGKWHLGHHPARHTPTRR